MDEHTGVKIARLVGPLFGGTTPGVSTVPAATTPPAPTPLTTEAQPVAQPENDPNADGGSDDPISKLASDPQAVAKLVADFDKLQKDLEKANVKIGEYDSERAKAERAQQTREQQLEQDLAQRDATIQQMDAVIRNMAITNALQGQKDLRFHSVKQAQAELNPEAFEIDVDLEKGTATVTGIDSEAQRIAKEFPWLVAKADTTDSGSNGAGSSRQTSGARKQSSSGAPPAPPQGADQKADRRKRLMSRYPVLSSGQAVK